MLADLRSPRGLRPKAVVEKTFTDGEGLVCRVRGVTSTSSFLRDVRKICLLEEAAQLKCVVVSLIAYLLVIPFVYCVGSLFAFFLCNNFALLLHGGGVM